MGGAREWDLKAGNGARRLGRDNTSMAYERAPLCDKMREVKGGRSC